MGTEIYLNHSSTHVKFSRTTPGYNFDKNGDRVSLLAESSPYVTQSDVKEYPARIILPHGSNAHLKLNDPNLGKLTLTIEQADDHMANLKGAKIQGIAKDSSTIRVNILSRSWDPVAQNEPDEQVRQLIGGIIFTPDTRKFAKETGAVRHTSAKKKR